MLRNADLSIHEFQDEDFSRLAVLGKTTYAEREISDENFLEWEYKNNFSGRALITVAESKFQSVPIAIGIAAQYIVIPREFSINNKIITGSLSVNTLTHPDFRGKSLFPILAEETFQRCEKENIHFTLGFPNPYSLPVIKKNNLFKIMGSLKFYIKPLTPIRSVLKYVFGRREKAGNEIEITFDDFPGKEISSFDFINDEEKFKEFLIKFNSEKENVTLRSIEFLKWRYLFIPRRKYHIFKLEEEGRISAILIFRAKYIYGLRCGLIVDFISISKTEKIQILNSFIKKIGRTNKLDILLTAITPHSEERKNFSRNGFYSLPSKILPQKLFVIMRSHLKDYSGSVENFSKWFLTFGDYDIF